jgi:hypothetical protein
MQSIPLVDFRLPRAHVYKDVDLLLDSIVSGPQRQRSYLGPFRHALQVTSRLSPK